ncbi:MAG: ATP-binding cassette domain-containing protein [Planctomycetia bacterium]|nr:MAG: ATP-binding cassette domain-containing protein [Planctomycetia bacterium]
MSDAVVISNVVKRYGSIAAVAGLSLRVPTGCIYGLLGPNGAGKTTTIRMVMSILVPDAGEIRLLGGHRALEVKDRIGYLPEERGLYRKMTVDATLRYLAALKGVPAGSINERIRAGLERVGLSAWRRKRVETLSKGMAQKVQILSAVLHEPELVILDEPFSGLDPLNVELVRELILSLRERGATVILSTHQMEMAQRLCDRIVLISRGRALAEGTPGEVRSQFAARTVVIEGEGDLRSVAARVGAGRAVIAGSHAEFDLPEGANPDDILRTAMETVRISRFEVQRPDLQQVFVRLVGADAADDRAGSATPGAERAAV